jgi:FKBP-type peptidyl-prolyl cis-trans isomerase FkpA
VYVPADSIFAYMGQPLPPGVPANSDLKFIVRILDIKSNKELRKELENKKDEESGIISEFVKENLPAAVKLENGIYYTTQKEGAGAAVNVGDTVVVSLWMEIFLIRTKHLHFRLGSDMLSVDGMKP